MEGQGAFRNLILSKSFLKACLVVTERKRVTRYPKVDGILFQDGSGRLSWQSHAEIDAINESATQRGWPEVIKARAWDARFAFRAEKSEGDGAVPPGDEGLRPPQVGALHAIGAHWSIYQTPATVVMPTGMGKTETVLSTLLDGPACRRSR
jgi:hypothetical protein